MNVYVLTINHISRRLTDKTIAQQLRKIADYIEMKGFHQDIFHTCFEITQPIVSNGEDAGDWHFVKPDPYAKGGE